MRVVSSSEMLTIEKSAAAEHNLSTSTLMERAGKAVSGYAERFLPLNGHVLILCGKGNNGGDGFVAARLLSKQGHHVTVFLLGKPDETAPVAFAAYKAIPPRVTRVDIVDFDRLDHALSKADVVIDAIFGFSLKGAITGPIAQVIERVNDSRKPVLAVDMPSGVEADTGKVHGAAIIADTTITFTAPKIGLLLHPGYDYAGDVITVDIGIPEDLLLKTARVRVLSAGDVEALLPARSVNAHKKSVGQVLVVAGSRGMPGAAILTGRAAYRMGAGVVAYAAPDSISPLLNAALVEAIVYPQAETTAGSLSTGAYESIIELAGRFDAVAIGPGLSTNPETVRLVQRLVSDIDAPMVIDADALNALVEKIGILSERRNKTVITPHPGEMARLFGVEPADIVSDWLGYVKRASVEFGVVAVLKGSRTAICNIDETTINVTGNPGLATAGTGDVLTGMIAALLAQGVDARNAAEVGVYLHGLAADLAVENLNEYSLIASDVIEYLPKAIGFIIGT